MCKPHRLRLALTEVFVVLSGCELNVGPRRQGGRGRIKAIERREVRGQAERGAGNLATFWTIALEKYIGGANSSFLSI